MTDREIDQQLVERVQKGEKVAFDLLVRKYQGRVYSVVKSLIKDSEESYDVAQEAFIKAYRAIGNFRGEAGFYTWVYRIAVNTAKNYLISKGRKPQAAGLDVYEVEDFGISDQFRELGTPEAYLEEGEVAKVVQETLEKLQPDLKTAIVLREFDGLSYDAIADIMECPIGTVRSRIFRAREELEKALSGLQNSI